MQAFRTVLVPRRQAAATETFTEIPSDILLYAVDAIFRLTIWSAASDGTDSLDVTIQHSYDKDHTYPGWDEFVAFGQILGTASDGAIELAQWSRGVSPETETRASSTSLAADNVVQGPVFPDLRVVATIVDGSASASFDYSIEALIWMEQR